MNIGAEIERIIAATQTVSDLTRAGSRANHEAEMALISLRNLQREIALWGEAKAGALGPLPTERPVLRLVTTGRLAPVDDPAFDV